MEPIVYRYTAHQTMISLSQSHYNPIHSSCTRLEPCYNFHCWHCSGRGTSRYIPWKESSHQDKCERKLIDAVRSVVRSLDLSLMLLYWKWESLPKVCQVGIFLRCSNCCWLSELLNLQYILRICSQRLCLYLSKQWFLHHMNEDRFECLWPKGFRNHRRNQFDRQRLI